MLKFRFEIFMDENNESFVKLVENITNHYGIVTDVRRCCTPNKTTGVYDKQRLIIGKVNLFRIRQLQAE